MAVLGKHHSAFGYSLQDLKGISPTLCINRIPIEPNIPPSREPQHRLNKCDERGCKEGSFKTIAHRHHLCCAA